MHTGMLQNLAAFVEGIAGKSARDDVELAAHVTSLDASLGNCSRASS